MLQIKHSFNFLLYRYS